MFKLGDTVLYGSDGVCQITEITEREFGTASIEYYVLTPVFDKRSTIFVPTKNEKLVSRMHGVLSLNQISDIINDNHVDDWIDNDIKRSEMQKEIISSGDFKSLAGLIRCISLYRDEIIQKGKKLHKSDEITYKEAIKLMYEEMALFLDVSKDDIADIICHKIPFDALIKKTV